MINVVLEVQTEDKKNEWIENEIISVTVANKQTQSTRWIGLYQ